jgi:hypothetical protein
MLLRRSGLRSIFVNYRRSDAEGESGRLFDDLADRFGAESVFMDVAAIEPGRDFRKAIDQSVAACSVLLAVMGREWLEAKDGAGSRRLNDPNDFVRIELASALRRDIPVIPVLVRGAKMPLAEQLPDDLKELAYRNAVELTHARWKSDVQVLIHALGPYVEVAGPGPAAASVVAIEARTVERVGRELAVFIGPIAEVVVKRAAKRCISVEDFYGIAAREIEGAADRARFLRACRG